MNEITKPSNGVPLAITLEDKYTATEGKVFMNGTQALVRLPIVQMRRDRAAGLNTGAFISGYRGSPVGGFDFALNQAKKHLKAHGIVFQPGVNEDLAATAVWGSQNAQLSPGVTKDGVLGIWYGKGPGVDRCGDVFKHANSFGTSPHGGVLAIAGDDHNAKSSTVAHQSDHAFMAAIMPMLFPSSVQEFVELGLLGIAMSRYAGLWVGYKVISDTIETTAVVDLAGEQRQFVLPTDFDLPKGGLNIRWPDDRYAQDERLQEYKAYAAIAFARANGIDQLAIDVKKPRFGIISSGKAYENVREALRHMGIDQQVAEAIGLRLYKVRMPWPLEPEGVRHFSEGLEEVLVIEERREVIEHQIKQQLVQLARRCAPAHRRQVRRQGPAHPVAARGRDDRRRAARHCIAPAQFRPAGRACGKAARAARLLRGAARDPRQPCRTGDAHAAFLLGLPAQHLDQGAGRQPRDGGHRLPLHGAVDEPQYRDLHPHGRRGRAVDGHRALHRREARFRQSGRRHLFPLGLPGDPPVGRGRQQHHLQDPLQRRGGDDRRPAGRRPAFRAATCRTSLRRRA